MKLSLTMLPLLLLTLFLAKPLLATEQYARATGKACSACHLDRAGGGELTAVGKTYLASLATTASPASAGTVTRFCRLVAGYLHMITAFLWFGTILYVHLVLKPAYAAHGLPKGEVRVGLVSMAVMAVTGTILTVMRIDSFDTLFHTHFGVLLIIKITIFLIMASSAFLVVLIIGPRLRRGITKGQGDMGGKEILTVADLMQRDGQEERPAFIAYSGRVFDVSASRLWKNGLHMGRHAAGADLTAALKLAPHGDDKIMAMPLVATLAAEERTPVTPLHQKVFFFMAYMNLCMVFSIVLILALWRWW